MLKVYLLLTNTKNTRCSYNVTDGIDVQSVEKGIMTFQVKDSASKNFTMEVIMILMLGD